MPCDVAQYKMPQRSLSKSWLNYYSLLGGRLLTSLWIFMSSVHSSVTCRWCSWVCMWNTHPPPSLWWVLWCYQGRRWGLSNQVLEVLLPLFQVSNCTKYSIEALTLLMQYLKIYMSDDDVCIHNTSLTYCDVTLLLTYSPWLPLSPQVYLSGLFERSNKHIGHSPAASQTEGVRKSCRRRGGKNHLQHARQLVYNLGTQICGGTIILTCVHLKVGDKTIGAVRTHPHLEATLDCSFLWRYCFSEECPLNFTIASSMAQWQWGE